MKNKGATVARYIQEHPIDSPERAREYAALLTLVGLAAKIIAREVSRAGLADRLGLTGEVNVQGEEVKKLDRYANDVFIRVFRDSGLVHTMASEEMEKPLHLPENYPHGEYLLLFDPIDGSSNIDVNVTIGSIFSILRAVTPGQPVSDADLLQKGTAQVAAGYMVYGPATLLVFTYGQGVHGFTLDPGIGEFLLSHEDIRIPSRGTTYSTNEGYVNNWYPHTRRFIEYLHEKDPATGRPYSSRYVGSLVADLHRTLLSGGIFLYPGDTTRPMGKLRLLYEVAPLAFVVEQAGGRASTGTERILTIQPTALHQRVPLLIGSPDDVALAEEFVQGRR